MDVGGCKRIAITTRVARKRRQEQDKTQHLQQDNLSHAETITGTCRKDAKLKKAADTIVPSSATGSHKKEKRRQCRVEKRQPQDGESEEKQRLQNKENGWLRDAENIEKQRLQSEEKRRRRKSDKQRKRRKRKERLKEDLQKKAIRTTENRTEIQERSAALDCPAERLTNFTPDESLQLKRQGSNSSADGPGAVRRQLSQPCQSRLSDYQSRTPQPSAPSGIPMIPTRSCRSPGALIITPRRRANLQLESIVSPSLFATLEAAANMLSILKARTIYVNRQIAAFDTLLIRTQSRQATTPKVQWNDLEMKAKSLKKIIIAMEKHSNEVFTMEMALRDMVDEGSGDLREVLRSIDVEFTELVKTYKGKMRRRMMRLSPEALEKTLQEVEERSDGGMQDTTV